MPNSPIMKFRLPEELNAKITALSRASGYSVSDIIRACIARALPYVEAKIQSATPHPSITEKDNPGPTTG